jgi:hypothetical protein
MNGPVSFLVRVYQNKEWALPVPVSLRVLIQRREHDGQNDFNVVADKVTEILVVPEVECSLGNL